jgi:hypothetical protein
MSGKGEALCPTCGGGIWPGRQIADCPDKFHKGMEYHPTATCEWPEWQRIAENRSKRIATLEHALESITDEFERTVAYADSRGKGGQHVPFHGDFASACQSPSFVSRARWWATHLRAALKTK